MTDNNSMNNFVMKFLDKMNAFEQSQSIISILQTIFLLFTLISAICIGVRQNEINENLLNLNYVPSIAVIYSNHRIQVNNYGDYNIWLWGTKFHQSKPEIDTIPRLIPPKGSYYLLADSLDSIMQQDMKLELSKRFSLDIYITNNSDQKYVVENILFCKRYMDSIIIHSQTVNIFQNNW